MSEASSAPQPFRVLPRVDDSNEHYWTGGANGELRILRCDACSTWLHPPAPVCPSCYGRALTPTATSGKGTLYTYTVNHQPWYPGLDPPYVIGAVELPEQAGMRITAGLVGIEPDEVEIGMALRVTFEQYDDVWLPFFESDA